MGTNSPLPDEEGNVFYDRAEDFTVEEIIQMAADNIRNFRDKDGKPAKSVILSIHGNDPNDSAIAGWNGSDAVGVVAIQSILDVMRDPRTASNLK